MKRAARLLCIVLIAVAVAGCHATAPSPQPDPYLARSRRSRLCGMAWTPVEAFRFDDASQMNRFTVLEGEWELRGGRLVATKGERNRTILVSRAGQDPVRVEFDARLNRNPEGRIGDITVLLNTTSGPTHWDDGYALTTSSFYDNCSTFYRLGKKLAQTEWSPAEPGEWRRVALEFDAGHIRYWLDGRIVLEAWDGDPLPLSPERRIGLRTWNTMLEVRNLTIYEGEPRP